MSIPYNHQMTGVKSTGGYPQYPLQSVNDLTHVVYNIQCKCLRADYVVPALTDTLANATSSKIVNPPFANGNAYFVGDISFADSDGGLMTFTRQFSTVPANRSGVYSGSISFPFPSTQGVYYTPPATKDAAESDDNLWEFREDKASDTSAGALYIDYVYFLASSPPTISTVFKSSQTGFVTDGGSGSFSNAKALNGDTFTGGYSVGVTTPSASSYASDVASGTLKNVDVRVNRYMGNIFVMETHKTAAK